MKCVRNVVYRPTYLSAGRRSGSLGDMGTVSIERRTSSSKVLWANIKALSQARHDRLNLIWFIFCLFEICILGSYWINFSFEKKMTGPRTDLHELPWPLFAPLHVLIRIMLSLLYSRLGNCVPMVTKLVLEMHALCKKNEKSYVK